MMDNSVVPIEDEPPTDPYPVEKWALYEQAKAEIAKTAKTPDEYEARIATLAAEMGL